MGLNKLRWPRRGRVRSRRELEHTKFCNPLVRNVAKLNKHSYWLKCHCDEILHFFFPFFFKQNNLPSFTMSFRPKRKKIKTTSFIKISPLEKWNFSSAITRSWFKLSPLFSQRHLYLWRHIPNTSLIYLWLPIDVSRVSILLVLAKSLWIRKFVSGKVCL